MPPCTPCINRKNRRKIGPHYGCNASSRPWGNTWQMPYLPVENFQRCWTFSSLHCLQTMLGYLAFFVGRLWRMHRITSTSHWKSWQIHGSLRKFVKKAWHCSNSPRKFSGLHSLQTALAQWKKNTGKSWKCSDMWRYLLPHWLFSIFKPYKISCGNPKQPISQIGKMVQNEQTLWSLPKKLLNNF